MKRPLAAAALLVSLVVLPGAGVAQSYDIEAYCAEVAAAVGGSYTIEASCRKNETAARDAASARSIEARIRRYCDEVAAAIGGSYTIFVSCVDQEEAARDSLN